jgi:hypothetical protein
VTETLTQDGTEVGEGAAPPAQWRVTFYGKTTPEQERGCARTRCN